MVSLLIRLEYVCSVQVFAKWPTAISRTDNIIRASVVADGVEVRRDWHSCHGIDG